MPTYTGDASDNEKSASIFERGREWTMSGLEGNDVLKSGRKNDKLYGGPGNDTLDGRWGDDELYGDDGDDDLDGSDGDDYLDGGSGNDQLRGGWGKDEIYGGLGDDVFDGNDGEDSLYGGAGDDNLNGGWQTDKLDGGDGNDILQGDSFAGKGDDTLIGGNGNDILVGGSGSNVLTGGDGADRFVFTPSTSFLNLANAAANAIKDLGEKPIGELAGAGWDALKEAYDAHDIITDFTVSQDKIDLSRFGFSFGSTTNALNIQTLGEDTFITFGESKNDITIRGVTGITFTSDYFIV
jgi:Ca2+-binding RTX toxin-like protein